MSLSQALLTGILSALFLRIEADYEFIIVGAGSAGSILAGRIAEELRADFLLLEAGGR